MKITPNRRNLKVLRLPCVKGAVERAFVNILNGFKGDCRTKNELQRETETENKIITNLNTTAETKNHRPYNAISILVSLSKSRSNQTIATPLKHQ